MTAVRQPESTTLPRHGVATRWQARPHEERRTVRRGRRHRTRTRESRLDTELLCELDESARRVLSVGFPSVPLVADVRTLKGLPKVDLVAAGFPCQDLSQAGKTAGIGGRQSGLVDEVFRLVGRKGAPTWLLIENVSFMLHLDGGRAMTHLTSNSPSSDSPGRIASSTPVHSAFRSVAKESSCWPRSPRIPFRSS